jgi:HK97 gp10 family phage protein
VSGKVEVLGLESVDKMLNELAPNHAAALMRATVHGVASSAGKKMKQMVPVDEGTIKKNIKTKRRKSSKAKPISDVMIGKDAFYWRFVEHGTSDGQAEQPFVRPVEDELRVNIADIAKKEFGKKLEKKLKSLAKKQAKSKA